MTIRPHDDTSDVAQGFSQRVRANQDRLAMNLKPRYDFVVCGAGTAGSVVARRLAENPDVTVLLVEAGGDDDAPSVTVANRWLTNLDSEHDWGFKGAPNPRINGRELPFSMGKVLGGGSAINAMVWARGHRSDWNFFATEADDPAWGYESVLDLYRRIEDWHGAPDPHYRGTGGPVFVQPAPEPSPLAPATVPLLGRSAYRRSTAPMAPCWKRLGEQRSATSVAVTGSVSRYSAPTPIRTWTGRT